MTTSDGGGPARIGPYEVVRELGRGGMGVVYEARSPDGARVAVKVLLDPTADAELCERFQREARACAALRHPNLIRVHDAGVEQGKPFIVMELLESESLADRLAREGALPLEEAVELVAELARALDYVHGQGIQHRDIKPDNVLWGLDGKPVITDFGLVRDPEREERRLTHTGQLLGTPGFMAPEQAAAEKHRVDHRVDIYALGATLYALLTGHAPFEGGSLVNVLKRVMEEPPRPPSRLRPDVDPRLDAICLRCLEKEPPDRYARAQELARALERYVDEGGRSVDPTRWLMVAVGGLALVLVIVLVVVLGQGTDPEPAKPAPPEPDVAPRVPVRVPPQKDWSGLHAQARAHTKARRWSRALAALDRVDPSARRAVDFVLRGWVHLWRFRYEGNRPNKAAARRAFARAVELDPRSAEAHAGLAFCIGSGPEFEKHAAQAMSLGKESSAAWRVRGRLHQLRASARRGQRDEAGWRREVAKVIEAHREALRLDPGATWATYALVGYLEALAVHVAPEYGVEARRVLEAALRREPRQPYFHFRRAAMLKGRGERQNDLSVMERAVVGFSRTVQLEPRFARAYLERGYLRGNLSFALRRAGHVERAAAVHRLAAEDCRQAMRIDKTSGHCARTLSVILINGGDDRGAEEALTEAIRRDPKNSDYYVRRGATRAKLRNDAGAIADFERALPLATRADVRKYIQAQLTKLRGKK